MGSDQMANVPASIFREYDVRGQAMRVSPGDQLTLTPEIVELIGQALGSRHVPGTAVLVSGDNRLSTPALRSAIAEGLCAAGLAVSLCEEEMPTGGASWLALTGPFSMVVQVTGSHTPPQFNGLKITERQENGKPSSDPSAIPVALYGKQLSGVYDDIQAGRIRRGASRGALQTITGLVAQYQDALIRQTRSLLPEESYQSKIRVVLDAGNGLGYYLKSVLEALGVQVHGIFLESDGRFPNHPADPLLARVDAAYNESGVRHASEEVTQLNANEQEGRKWIAIVTDGDGDRSGVIDELGMPVRPETLGMLFYRKYLEDNVAAVRYLGAVGKTFHMALDVRGTSVFHQVLQDWSSVSPRFIPAGYPIHRAFARGEITQLMRWRDELPLESPEWKALDALLRSYVSAEISGHFFFNLTPRLPEVLVDDGLFAALTVLRILDKSLQSDPAILEPLSRIVRAFPAKCASEEIRLDCPDDLKFGIVEKIRAEALKRFHEQMLPVRPIELIHNIRTQEPESGLVEVDGVRVQFKDGSFFLIRASNTSAMLTFRFEGPSRETLRARQQDVVTLLQPFKKDIGPLDALVGQDEVTK